MTVDSGHNHVASPEEMRRVLGAFVSGVTIVTGTDAGEPVGFACQSFASVSLDPPLVLFCAAHTSRSWPRIHRSGSFCVNVLAADQQDVCSVFAAPGADRFAGVAWHRTDWGPALDDSIATVMCDIEAVHPAGDHDVVIGHVRRLITSREHGPLVYFRGAFGLDAAVVDGE